MHETSLMEQVLIIADEELAKYNVKKVNNLTVAVGVMANVIPGALEFAFEALSKNTSLAQAGLVLESVPIDACCRDCGESYRAEKVPLSCPRCLSHNAQITGGTDVYLTSIDFEEAGENDDEN